MPDRPLRPLIAVAALAALARALMIQGVELYSDEAYYWLWSRRPAAGYFDHPPLVAWLIGLSSSLVAGELGVRILFVICGGLAVLFAGLTARELTDDPRAPLYAALLAAASPMLILTGSLALPDAPVEAAYAAAAWLLVRARGRRWVGAGLAVGIALLAKYTTALLAPALVLLVLWDGELRRELRTRWPWLGAAVAVLVFAPCLVWNARHDFVSIRFQLGHGFGRHASLSTFGEYLAGQLGGPGPVATVLGIALLARARRSPEKRLAVMTLFPLVVTTYAATRGPVEANWPALVYPWLCAAAGVACARLSRRLAGALVGASVAAAALLAVAFAVEERWPRLLPPASAAVERFHGWREFARDAREAARESCVSIGDPAGCADDPFCFGVNYQYAGELAFYAGWRRFGAATERASQLDVWGDTPPPGAPFLFVGFDGMTSEARARLRAAEEGSTEPFEIRIRGEKIREGSITAFGRFLGFAGRNP